MICRRQHPQSPSCLAFIFLSTFLLLVMGCPKDIGITPPKPVVGDAAALQKAQNLFNEAGGLDRPSIDIPPGAGAKYQQVADIIEKDVLGKVMQDLEVTAYALLSFSRWRLGNYAGAIEAGAKGRRLYEVQKLTTNVRDYGMCLIVGGLCLASQTHQEFKSHRGPLTKEVARGLTDKLARAMNDINAINSRLDRREDIVIYANQWQLAIIDQAVHIWTSLPRDVSREETCNWLARSDGVLAKFHPPPYTNQDFTIRLKEKFEAKKKQLCQGG